jgi:dTDP-L-rhamnose 4-epimerase
MYEVERYTSTNDLGTAVLFERLIDHPVRRVVTASSMSIYGEGLYRDREGCLVEDAQRRILRDGQADWEPVDVQGRPLTPVATPEWKRPNLSSIYALNKYVQERTTHIMSASYGIEGVCLRLFNVYGAGQALSNPYTGVLAIFASRLLNGQVPMIFEDGEQRRDFVHVRDVARGFATALEHPGAPGETFNVGSGRDISVKQVAQELAAAMGKNDIEPEIVHKARIGDIRHCFCDTGKAREHLGFEAREDFAAGLTELAEWVGSQTAEDRVEEARRQLETRGLVA